MHVCEACRRHIFDVEATCPFCARATPRLLRAGALAAGLTLLAGCPSIGPVYGAPPEPEPELRSDAEAFDAGADAGDSGASGQDPR